MRGHKNRQQAIWCEFNLEQRIRADRPLRAIKKLADDELARLNDRFNAAYSAFGKPSIPPETLIKARFCRRSIRSAPSASSARTSTSICSTAGSFT